MKKHQIKPILIILGSWTTVVGFYFFLGNYPPEQSPLTFLLRLTAPLYGSLILILGISIKSSSVKTK